MDLLQQISRDEGRKYRLYLDSRGIPTAGVGRNLRDVAFGDDEIDLMLANDIKRAKTALSSFSWFAGLDEVRQGALINMCFNLGFLGLLHFPHMISALAKGDWQTASNEALASDWAKQVGDRATRLAKQLLTGEWQ